MAYLISSHAVERVGVKSAKRTRSWLWSVETLRPPMQKGQKDKRLVGWLGWLWGWVWSGLGRAFYRGFELKEGWLGLVLGWGPSSKPKQVSVPAVILGSVGSVW